MDFDKKEAYEGFEDLLDIKGKKNKDEWVLDFVKLKEWWYHL